LTRTHKAGRHVPILALVLPPRLNYRPPLTFFSTYMDFFFSWKSLYFSRQHPMPHTWMETKWEVICNEMATKVTKSTLFT